MEVQLVLYFVLLQRSAQLPSLLSQWSCHRGPLPLASITCNSFPLNSLSVVFQTLRINKLKVPKQYSSLYFYLPAIIATYHVPDLYYSWLIKSVKDKASVCTFPSKLRTADTVSAHTKSALRTKPPKTKQKKSNLELK